MRREEEIRDFQHRIIGRIITDDRTGEIEVRDFYNRKLGYYEPKSDTTRDFYGRVVAHGCAPRMLIRSYDEMMDKNWRP